MSYPDPAWYKTPEYRRQTVELGILSVLGIASLVLIVALARCWF